MPFQYSLNKIFKSQWLITIQLILLIGCIVWQQGYSLQIHQQFLNNNRDSRGNPNYLEKNYISVISRNIEKIARLLRNSNKIGFISEKNANDGSGNARENNYNIAQYYIYPKILYLFEQQDTNIVYMPITQNYFDKNNPIYPHFADYKLLYAIDKEFYVIVKRK